MATLTEYTLRDGFDNNVAVNIIDWGESSPENFANKYYISAYAIEQASGIPENVTLFCLETYKAYLINHGYLNTISIEEINYKLVFNNGNYIKFDVLTDSVDVLLYLSDDTLICRYLISIRNDGSGFAILSDKQTLYRNTAGAYRYLYYYLDNLRATSSGVFRTGIAYISSPLTSQYPTDTIALFWEGISPGPTPEEDPYALGGVTDKEGGDGDFDTFSDEIPVPELPTVTVDNTGFISLYSPSIAQLKSLASYLWASTGLDLDTFKRIFTDPISTILGLTIVPVTPPAGGSNNVVLGNVDTGVSMPRISNQYVQYDCGTLNVNEFWGGYLDYSPYTSLEIYLPFIGTKPLNIDDVMGHTVHVVYNIDLLSGACCAVIESARRVLYQFIGQCSCSVPVTGRDMTNLINGILSVVGAGAGTFVATGGNPGLSGASAIGALASNVSKSKPKVEKSGSMGSMGGMLGVRCPYLIITRPRQALPATQNRYTGYPSFITCVLSDLVGYTEIYKVHLGDIPATDAEKAEIETLLMNGVIL